MTETTTNHSLAVSEALERVAKELEGRAGNSAYRAAWKVAAKIVRASKPE